MKKNLKAMFATLALAVTIPFSMTACDFAGLGDNGETPNNKQEQVNPDLNDGNKDNPSIGANGGETNKDDETKEDVVKYSRLNTFFEQLNAWNFTYQTNSQSVVKVDGNMVQIGQKLYENATNKNGKPVKYVYTSDMYGRYTKDFYEPNGGEDVFEGVFNFINNIQNKIDWTTEDGVHYEGDTHSDLFGTVKLNFYDENGVPIVALSFRDAEGYLNQTRWWDIWQTNLSRPEVAFDKTGSDSKLVFDASSKKWDRKLLAETLVDWIAKNDYMSKLMRNSGDTFDEILYLNLDGEKVTLGAMTTSAFRGEAYHGEPIFRQMEASDEFSNFLLSGKSLSVSDVTDYLNQNLSNWPIKNTRGIESVICEYTKSNATEEQKEIFNAMIPMLLKGAQEKYNIDLSHAEVLNYFKTTNTHEDINADYRFYTSWKNHLLVKNGENVQLLTIGVAASTYYGEGPYENVKNGVNFNIGTFDKIEIDNGNLGLYNTKDNFLSKV